MSLHDEPKAPRCWQPDDCMAATALTRCVNVQAGKQLTIIWPLFNPDITTMLRFTPYGGATRTVVQGPQLRQWSLPEVTGVWTVARQYLRLGIHHILLGIDYLLFARACC